MFAHTVLRKVSQRTCLGGCTQAAPSLHLQTTRVNMKPGNGVSQTVAPKTTSFQWLCVCLLPTLSDECSFFFFSIPHYCWNQFHSGSLFACLVACQKGLKRRRLTVCPGHSPGTGRARGRGRDMTPSIRKNPRPGRQQRKGPNGARRCARRRIES